NSLDSGCWSHGAQLENRSGRFAGAGVPVHEFETSYDGRDLAPGDLEELGRAKLWAARSEGLPVACAERGLPSALLLSAVALALAGGGESRRPGTGGRGCGIRPVRALALVHDEAALGHRAARIRSPGPAAGVHALQRVPARRVQVRL